VRLRKPKGVMMVCNGDPEPEPESEFGFMRRVWFRLWLAKKRVGWLMEKITKKIKRRD
jgi:hypothetical protein